jgi:NodT family efflux transporter outer membrane factor (OMF) lipoprotein
MAACGAVALSTGCTSLRDWANNGFKVGPNFQPPPAAVAPTWVDSANPRLAAVRPDPAWWAVFNDPLLTDLIAAASRDNLDVRTAGTRVLQSQFQRNIDCGQLFPQTQSMVGAIAHAQIGPNGSPIAGLGGLGAGVPASNQQAAGTTYLNLTSTGFNLSWELDFWGKYRRTLESDDANLAASLDGVADALVMVIAEVATDYMQVRTAQERLRFARENIEAQRGSLKLAQDKLTEGRGSGLDVAQAEENLAKTEAGVPAIELALRQANNKLALALGRPPGDLVPGLGDGSIPTPPATAAVGIPAELLERRPDVRQALRQAAAQSAEIGVAEADFYPSVGVSGYLGYGSTNITKLVTPDSFIGYILPNFQWKILNYGRTLNNVRLQDAKLQQTILNYQNKVLTAGQEAENAIAGYLQYQVQVQAYERAVRASQKTVELTLVQYKEGRTDFNRLFTVQADLAQQQDSLATARGNVATNLIAVYKALGGGWEAFCQPRAVSPADIRLQSPPPVAAAPAPTAVTQAAAAVPAPGPRAVPGGLAPPGSRWARP